MLDLDSANIAQTGVKTDAQTKAGKVMARNPFYTLLGDCYTLVVRECTHVRVFLLLKINDILPLKHSKQEG